MRLIDADALNAALDRRLEDVGNTASTVFDIIVIAPTVSCGECKWYYNGRRGICCRFCYCGDEFERREP